MTTHSTANSGHNGRQDGFASANVSYRPQPGSPTLTNPDMILPDYDEPEPLDERSHSPLVMWNNAHTSHDFHDFSQAGYISGPLPPTTPIIYGNGTMLSDIGEVTEVESTVGGHRPNRNSSGLSGTPNTGSGTPLRSSPTMGKKTLKKKPHAITKRERRLSIESTSSVDTIEGPQTAFGDFDDSVSVDDSNFQGDDEESLASEFVDETSVQNPSAAVMPSGQGLNEDRLSTVSLSKRAEQILANAKRRLTTMEDNLNRARTFSYSSEGSTPSPGARQNGSIRDRTQMVTPSHSRNVSENSLQGAGRTAMLPQRSASALGAAGGYRQHLTLSRSVDGLMSKHTSSALKSPLYSIDSALEPLDEDDTAQEEDDFNYTGSQIRGLGSPTFGSHMEAGVTRSASAAQMRDLQDQMQGLKGKISSLRQQAQADSMKRRSLQSLRAPSPFTHSRWDQGYTSPTQTNTPEVGSPVLVNPVNGNSAGFDDNKIQEETTQAEPQPRDEQSAESAVNGSQEPRESQDPSKQQQLVGAPEEVTMNGEHKAEPQNNANEEEKADDDTHRENGVAPETYQEDQDQEDFEDYVSESGESLYHDTHQDPTDISHEDREDAFDYEHFFLHSAMGTLSRQRMGRSDSISSEGSQDSVETTRGPAMTYARRPSIDTTTSIDTFATAREGTESRSSIARSTRTNDGFVTPTVNYDDEDSSSMTTKRSAFGDFGHRNGNRSGSGSGSGSGSDSTGYDQRHTRHNSVIHRPISTGTASMLHRPSVSSFESTGTNRSFPLVNRVRLSQGALTPSGSPDNQLKQVAESLMNETTSMYDRDSSGSGPQSPAIQTLSREDQMLVEQVVASLGRCVLGLSEATRLGTGNHNEYRERIEAARKMLESIGDRAPMAP